MGKNLTHKIVLRKSVLPESINLLELPLAKKETYRIKDKDEKKRKLYSSLSYSFE